MVKTLKLQNKEKVLKDVRDNSEVTYKGRSIRIRPDFQQKLSKPEDPGKRYSKF